MLRTVRRASNRKSGDLTEPGVLEIAVVRHAAMRALLRGLGGLLADCSLFVPQVRIDPMLQPLQNPKYPGDANKDLVPCQARERDGAECRLKPRPLLHMHVRAELEVRRLIGTAA